jgi:hypothetical protein
MCPSGTTCLSVDCCFRELTLNNYHLLTHLLEVTKNDKILKCYSFQYGMSIIKISSYHNKSNNITSVQSSHLPFYSGPVSSNIYRPTINTTGPNLKITLMTINSNHQNSKHDDVPNIMWTYQLCIR